MPKQLFPVAVHVLICRDNQILLTRRANTGFEDGHFSLIGGHLDSSETIKQAAIRECFEEVGIVVEVDDVTIVGVEHYKSNLGDDVQGIDFYCKVNTWQGEPWAKSECDCVTWFGLDKLPENMIEFMRDAVVRYASKKTPVSWFSEIGF